jgi:peptidylprolyl isomerase
VITAPVESIFGAIDEDDYLQNTSTVVVLVDVYQTFLPKADGPSRLPQSGMPTVTQTDEGVHGLSFPNAPIPEELRVSVLKQGSGPAIEDGDFVTAHFTGAVWNTREVFIRSFDQGIPLSLIATDIRALGGGQEGVIPGISEALIGQTVGSQVLVSIPPDLGYPQGQAPPGVPDNATLVYVFDILGVSN